MKGVALLAVVAWGALLQACGATLPEGEVTVTYGTPPPPDPDGISAQDGSSLIGMVRVSKELLSDDIPLFSKSSHPQTPPPRPCWDLSFLVEGSRTSSDDEVKTTSGYFQIGGVKVNAPARMQADWTVSDLNFDLQLRTDLGKVVDFYLGVGYGHAAVDLKYHVDDGRTIDESETLNGFDLRFGFGAHATTWLQFGLEFDMLLGSESLLSFEPVAIVRPWSVVGVIAGWRFWYFQDTKREGSELHLLSGGPVIGLELRF